MLLPEFASHLRTLEWGFATAARFSALRQLGETSLKGKRSAAQETVRLIEAAHVINDFASRHYVTDTPAVHWCDDVNPLRTKALSDGVVDMARLCRSRDDLLLQLGATLRMLVDLAEADELLRPAIVLRSLLAEMPASQGAESLPPRRLPGSKRLEAVKVLRGPTHVNTDPAFEPTYSLLQQPLSSFGDTLRENVPYFWSLAIRESLAADLCALSMIEYDRMPLSFYRDMAKQCWDEMRHSIYFFELALLLIPELLEELEEGDPLHESLSRFQRTGKGLPIPREGNLYEAILNASLVERLILLHRDTETPGILRIKEKINSAFCASRPQLAAALEIVMRDEVTHSRFGNVWLRHLVPDERERQEAIATTELLRGVLLLSSFAHHGGGSLSQLLWRYAHGEVAPVSALQIPGAQPRPPARARVPA